MRAPAVSFANKFFAALMAALLMFTLLPASALAEGEGDAGVSAEGTQEADSGQVDEAAGAGTPEDAEPDTAVSVPLASALAGAPTAFVNADVALDGEPVVGSFTVDGLTFAVTEGSDVELVGAARAEGAFGSEVPTSPQPPSAPTTEAEALPLILPEFVAYNDVDYAVSSIGAYAFYLSGVTAVELPASVTDVDDRAFRSSDVASAEIAEGNPAYSSFDGALYDADQLSLLLIPEGKQGTVLLPKEAESAPPSVFSHCPLVTQVSVEEGSAAFASENGLLYDANLETLLRVPAGATDITIREGCTTIAAGAMEGCAKLSTITAPASVTSISPDIFTSVPTVSLPAATVADDGVEEAEGTFGSEAPTSPQPPSASSTEASSSVGAQLTAMVALSLADDMLKIDPSSIVVMLDSEVSQFVWQSLGFSITINDATLADKEGYPLSGIEEQGSFYAVSGVDVYGNGGTLRRSGIDYPALTFTGDAYVTFSGGGITYPVVTTAQNPGCSFRFWGTRYDATSGFTSHTISSGRASYFAIWNVPITWESNGGYWDDGSADQSRSSTHSSNTAVTGYGGTTLPKRNGHRFTGWKSSEDGDVFAAGANVEVLRKVTYAAQWERVDYDLGFDVDAEPGDEDYPGIEKPDETITGDQIEADDKIEVEDPKRPGYVFQGWVIPREDGTTAIEQELVYQDEADGKWYVDASKLPDYATDGRVELTARWTAAVKVDAPLSATFYYDLTQPDGEGYFDEQRDAAVEGATGVVGTAAIRNHSAMPLRVAGMESATSPSSARLLKKGDQWLNDLPKGQVGVLTVFPTTNEATGTADAALGPSSANQAAGDDLAHAVTLALDEVKLEAAFDAGAWAIDAATVGEGGVVSATGDLRLGYRLDLGGEGGVTLDYEALLSATGGEEGASADLTSVSYCFAFEGPRPTGTKQDALWVEVTDAEVGSVGVYGLDDIKAAADDLSSRVDPATDPNDWASIESQIAASPYAKLYTELMEGGACFKLKVDGVYHDVQLLGICQDTRSDNGRRAGLAFQMSDIYAYNNKKSNAAGGGAFNTQMNPLDKNDGGWEAMPLRDRLRTTFMNSLDGRLRSSIAPLRKSQQVFGDIGATSIQHTVGETIWLPSRYELSGITFDRYNESEAIEDGGYKPFQYQVFAGDSSSKLYNKHFNDSIPGWWTRSAYRSNRSIFCQQNGADGRFSQNAAYAGGVAPCFAL